MIDFNDYTVKDKPFIIIDGNNMAYRSAAVTNLTNRAGQSVAVPFGVIRSIRFIIEFFRPRGIAIVWDEGRHPLRVDMLTEYKRSASKKRNKGQFEDKDMFVTMKIAQRLVKLLGIPQYQFEDNEADDIIAKMTEQLNDVIIISSDKDFYQLLSNNVSVYNPISNNLYTPLNFMELTSFPFGLEEYMEYHILLGDKSDNIPGVPGVGKKTASDLIAKYKSISKTIKAITSSPESFPKRVRNIIEKSAIKQLDMNREMIDLKRFANNIKLGANLLKDNPKSNYKKFKIVVGKKRLDFKSILNDFPYWIMPFSKLNLRRKYATKDTISL